MSKPPTVSLRVNVPLALFERIGEYRHTARHETRGQAMVALISAGLAALAKPVELPPASEPPPNRARKLVAFAGADGRAGRL